MRKFLPVLLCAACGDNLLVEEPDQEHAPTVVDDDPTLEDATPHLAPAVCASRAWPQIAIDRAADVSIAPSIHGTTVFAASGGDLLGWHLDHAGELQTPKAGTVLRTGHFTAVAAAYVDDRMIAASVSDDGVLVDMIRRDLGATINVEKLHGGLIADVPVAHVRADRFTAYADVDEGVTGIHFAADWRPSAVQQLSPKAVLAITATPYRDDTMVAWSTKDTCHLMRVGAQRTSERGFACTGARIAMNDLARRGYIVYEDGARVMIGQIVVGGESELANTRVLAFHGSAPKITFDGTRFWVSYIDARDDVVIGYLDAQGTLVSMAVEGTRPLRDGYELVIRDGHEVWLYATDGGSLAAQRFCLEPV